VDRLHEVIRRARSVSLRLAAVPGVVLAAVLAAVLATVSLCAGCTGVRTIADPVVVVETRGGRELGVSTEYGLAFLGRTAQSGPASLTAWYGDGPQTERSAIEPIGGGLFTAQTEIRFPEAAMCFEEPRPGDKVLIVGRHRGKRWDKTVRVEKDARVEGLLLPTVSEIESSPEQVGAGVFVEKDNVPNPELVGLVSGVVTLTEGGKSSRYLTVVCMRDLWRLVAHRRELDRRRPLPSREDVR
jgi:hypothetical protein